MDTSNSVKNRPKSTKMRKLLFFCFLSGTWQKSGQKSLQKYRIPDDVSGFQNFGTPFWTFSQWKRAFSRISEKRDLSHIVFAPRSSKKSSIFEDFYHFYDQNSKNDVFGDNAPYTEHFCYVFPWFFSCIMHMYWLHIVWRFVSHFHPSIYSYISLTK